MNRTLQRATAMLSVSLLVLPDAVGASEKLIDLASSGREAKYTLPADTREVELVSQRSGQCRFGRTWGYDLAARELWVNGGCAGQFKIIAHEAGKGPPSSSNAGAALAAAAAIAGVAILASRGKHDDDRSSAQGGYYAPPNNPGYYEPPNNPGYYTPPNSPNYYPPSAGYHPPQAGSYPSGGGRQGTIHGPGGMCLDMRGGLIQGTQAIIHSCHGRNNQRFNWTPRGELIVGNMCLDVAGGSRENGASVIAWECNGNRNQQWVVNGTRIQSKQNGKCLDVAGGMIRTDAPVIVHDCHGGQNQRWFW
ncbi:MAG: lectin [Burkholderiaceae bacterium]